MTITDMLSYAKLSETKITIYYNYKHSLPLGTHCVFSTHAYCFARIVLIMYAFTVKGRILLLPGILSEL